LRLAAADSTSDEELARRARRGSTACFEELVRRYQVPLLRMIQRKLARADAEDVLQETFLRAFERLDQYSERWPFRTWIFTIAWRQAISRLRSARPAAPSAPLDYAPAAAPGPAELVSRSDQRQRLWDVAREHLTHEQFAAVWLFYVEDMPAPQIASTLGRSWVSVKTMLHRARKTLAPFLAGLAPTPCTPSMAARAAGES
jgi:RNA polymerase sigma-70 factor (ECF subfamily)